MVKWYASRNRHPPQVLICYKANRPLIFLGHSLGGIVIKKV
jgi:surfactin synthase thioesterase subunit